MIPVSSSNAAETNLGFVLSTAAIVRSGEAAMALPDMSDTAPAAISSCGVPIEIMPASWAGMSSSDIVSESVAVRSSAAPASTISFVPPASLAYIPDRSASDTSIASSKVIVSIPESSSNAACAKTGLAVSAVTATGLSGAASIVFPLRSDTAPAAISSCGVDIGMIAFSCAWLSVSDIVGESGAVPSKAAPASATSFVSPASLTYILDKSAAVTFTASSNVIVMIPVSSSSAADANSGLSSRDTTVMSKVSESAPPRPSSTVMVTVCVLFTSPWEGVQTSVPSVALNTAAAGSVPRVRLNECSSVGSSSVRVGVTVSSNPSSAVRFPIVPRTGALLSRVTFTVTIPRTESVPSVTV